VREAEGACTPGGGPQAESAEAELARLRAENARLLKAEKVWQLEREILRRAAAYMVGMGGGQDHVTEYLCCRIRSKSQEFEPQISIDWLPWGVGA
jgi:hypothetical protein